MRTHLFSGRSPLPSLSSAKSATWLAAIVLSVHVEQGFASVSKSPEIETLEIAKKLKPIADQEWKEIAGAKVTEKYEIAKGDTLYDISKRLFGDAKYWPKIWALNNQSITNPHVIQPGNSINFIPGTGSSLPSVGIETAESGEIQTDAEPPTHVPSQDWKKLPTQPWEIAKFELPKEIDASGFDSRSRVKAVTTGNFELTHLILSRKVQSLGMIFGLEKEGLSAGLQDLVFIRSAGNVQPGRTYSIAATPEKILGDTPEREGFIYHILGRVKIEQQRDGAFIGMIQNVTGIISPGAALIPLQAPVPDMAPIPGPAAVEARVYFDHETTSNAAAQHKIIYLDRGSDDGVSPGMIFRSYQHFSPSNHKRLTHANALILAEMMVLHSSTKFSTALILRGSSYLSESSSAFLMTDVSPLLKKRLNNEYRLETTGAAPPDELDSLDSGAGLKENEKLELEQLEKWKDGALPPPPSNEENPVAPEAVTPVPAPSTAPESPVIPEPETPPPPPAENLSPAEPTIPEPAAPGEPAIPTAPAPSEELPPPPPGV